ncbi:hypothetical protein B9Z19DRAFT_370688 [Tuber borchii]|uniref:Uncharacterized protein n=1 Tax=Tuber borchii TaxID=42251 RepID=A0A2T7A4E5_TUBBO|nr:hypothetical protein B9Z19DRAFT_370688 [Tuber borchii]
MLNLQNTLDDAKAGKSELIKTKERVEAENHQRESDNRSLSTEKRNLHNEVEKLKGDIRDRSFTYKGNIRAREGQYRELEDQLDHIRQEYEDLQPSYQEKSEEVGRLQARLDERDGDIEGEFATLQRQVNNLKRERGRGSGEIAY